MSIEVDCYKSDFGRLYAAMCGVDSDGSLPMYKVLRAIRGAYLEIPGMHADPDTYFAFTTVLLIRAGFDFSDILEFWKSLGGVENLIDFCSRVPKNFDSVSHYEAGGDAIKKWGDAIGVKFGGALTGYSYLEDGGGYRGGINNQLLSLKNADQIIPEPVDIISAAKVFEIGSGCSRILPPNVSFTPWYQAHYAACMELLAAMVNRLKPGGYVVIENSFCISQDFLRFLGLNCSKIMGSLIPQDGRGDDVYVLQYCPELRALDKMFFPYYHGVQFSLEDDQVSLIAA